MRHFFLKHLWLWKFHSSMLFRLKARADPKRKISSVLVKPERCCGEPIFQTCSIVLNGFVHPSIPPLLFLPSDRWMTSVFPSFRHEIICTRRLRIGFRIRFPFSRRGWFKMSELGERAVLSRTASRRKDIRHCLANAFAVRYRREKYYVYPSWAVSARSSTDVVTQRSNRGILFGRRGGLISRRWNAAAPYRALTTLERSVSRAYRIAPQTLLISWNSETFAGYSILLIHFREFKDPLAFSRSTT